MANTIKVNEHMITVGGLDTDWTLATSTEMLPYATNGLRIRSIRYNPGTSTGDNFKLTNVAASTGALLFHAKTSTSLAGDEKIQYYGGDKGMRAFPVFTGSDCKVSSGSTFTIELA